MTDLQCKKRLQKELILLNHNTATSAVYLWPYTVACITYFYRL